MRFSESWLRSHVNPPCSTEELAESLTMAGLEVEEIRPFAPPFDQVVVGLVRAVAPHPDADKLRVCEVDIGREAALTIVCGAPNVAVGLKVPCALAGATLPGGVTIRVAPVRGVQSHGMLCSARELGLSQDHAGLWVLPPEAPVGEDLRRYAQLDDAILTLKLTPNRPDCLGVRGIAREVSAASGAPLSPIAFEPVSATIEDRLPVRIEASDLCGRFCGRVIRGVNPKAPTPAWIRMRLEQAGQRSISALVDLSNYVMLELGRPTHVFDLGKVQGGLTVRWARAGEQLELLNGQTIELDERCGVIADERGPESLAGIMGGQATAVSDSTTDIYVEAAFWWPAAIAGRARRFNFSTDAAHRFERGVDAHTTAEHLDYLSQLIVSVCGGQAGPLDDTVLELPRREPVAMRTERARRIIGVAITDDQMQQAFERLGLSFVREADRFIVTPPSWRFDLSIEEDLIEEVVRLWGFERLPVRPPQASASMLASAERHRPLLALKRLVAARDYQEVINFSFVDSRLQSQLGAQAPVALLNPIAAQMDVLRATLTASLLEALRRNLNRKASRVRLFEVGRVFRHDPSVAQGPLAVAGIDQPLMLGLLAYGPVAEEQWATPERVVDFFDLKGDLESLFGRDRLRFERDDSAALHPGRSAKILLDGQAIGRLGSLHPALQQAVELPLAPVLAELALEPLLQRPLAQARELSRFPSVSRDLAVVVSEAIAAQTVLDEIRAALAQSVLGKAVNHVGLFDEYRGKGLENKEKSLAFRILMQDTEKTLGDAEVAQVIGEVVDRLSKNLGARLRA
jgi:phenylalanyl-tRNA synthetase beta chain